MFKEEYEYCQQEFLAIRRWDKRIHEINKEFIQFYLAEEPTLMNIYQILYKKSNEFSEEERESYNKFCRFLVQQGVAKEEDLFYTKETLDKAKEEAHNILSNLQFT